MVVHHREAALSMAAGNAVALAAGCLLVLIMLSDAIGTLVVTRGRTGRWRPTRIWYVSTWRATRFVASRLPERAADLLLNIYPASSLLGLLLIWLVGLALGWALVYHGLGGAVAGSRDFGDLVYYSGTALLTPAFGAVAGSGERLLGLVETVTGLGTIALLISYLPALYGAYSRREARLLTLDDPRGGRITPVRVVATHAVNGQLEPFYRFCAEWEMWTAEVLESHVSYPMLAVFRSQHPGQSWVTALGVVTDAATLACACIEGAEAREAYFLHRRGRRAIVDIAAALTLPPPRQERTWLNREAFGLGWQQLVELGVPLRDHEEAWQRLQELRAPYGMRLEQLIDVCLAPRGFWGHSAEATVVAEVARATALARAGARRSGGA